jgi:hypothetical protein
LYVPIFDIHLSEFNRGISQKITEGLIDLNHIAFDIENMDAFDCPPKEKAIPVVGYSRSHLPPKGCCPNDA